MGVGTIGPPGRRQFFLRASRGGESFVLYCEKFHVQGLVIRMRQLLEDHGLQPTEGETAPAGIPVRPPMDPGPSFDPVAVEAALRRLPIVELKGLFRRSSNYTFLVELRGGCGPPERLLAVYKPARGE